MSKRTIGVLAATGLLAVAGTIPAAAQDNVVTIPDGEPIRVATYGVLSGPDASLGQDWLDGVRLHIEDIGGEILGREIEIVAEDGLCTVEGGALAAQKIASDPTVVGVIGSACSDETVGGIQAITEAGLTAISPSATRPALTEADRPAEYAGFLRTAHSDAFQGKAVAEFVKNTLGLETAATIHDGSAYAEALVGVFVDEFTALGGTITKEEAVSKGQTDMNPVLTSIAADGPQAIYYPVFVAEGGLLTAEIPEVAGLEDVVRIGSDGLFTPDFVTASGPAIEGVYLSSPNFGAFTGDYAGLVERYTDFAGQAPPSAFHAHGYDAIGIMLTALASVAVENDDGSLTVDRGALRDAVYATDGYEGITGNLSCSDSGDCGAPLIAVYELGGDVAGGEWPPTDVVFP
jgi:branched-chain amino acid transport system substrate-binding protein